MKRNLPTILAVAALLAALLAASSAVLAGPAARPNLAGGVPTVVSYQGQVTVGGAPFNGTGDFKFAVVDAAGTTTFWSNDGTASGQPAQAVQLTVANGLFTILLGDTSLTNMTALPASAFAGTERYLRVWFSGDGTTFTQLAPDRRIAAVPYALQAQEAQQAQQATNSAQLGGLPATAFQQREQNVVTVAKSGGDYTTITAALDSITDASATNRYLVRVAPGVYNERVAMKPYVDIEGAGEQSTKITSTLSTNPTTATVVGANNAELRFLTVENTGAQAYAVAIYNNSTSPRLTHVTVSASGTGSWAYGVYNDASSSPTLTSVTITVSGSTSGSSSAAFGVSNASSSPAMTGVNITVSGAPTNYGVYSSGGSVTMADVTISASGGTYSYGLYNYSSSLAMTNVTATASGAANGYGLYNERSSLTIRRSTIRATGTAISRYGIYNQSATSGSYTVRVDASQLEGATNALWNGTSFTTYLGATQVTGGIANTGTITCTATYDGSYAPVTCP